MGTWGTGILENDNALDYYDRFFEYYNEGLKPEEINEKLKNEFSDLNEESGNIYDFWFAIALAKWETCSLDEETLAKVSQYIEDEKDITIWQELDADAQTIEDRKKELEQFLKKIQIPRDKPKPRVMVEPKSSLLKKEDLNRVPRWKFWKR
ncbi:DUF4259 domain-containing protein [Flammeovirga sp. SJP92]|uniref:DUF4259 domain-containing protein n=1 Tax=Flammeovirga sp. SJP92 TaxID=1775430 RepID=UPI00078849F7|nr:DUF4259 domain-containing protein [Flammeovirga sp. SJP92]KXX69125.1 hypothetical protein AVL50_16945 [Flammeovirga sp. SJP92]